MRSVWRGSGTMALEPCTCRPLIHAPLNFRQWMMLTSFPCPTQALYWWIKRHRWWIKDCFYCLTQEKMRWIIESGSRKLHQAPTSLGLTDLTEGSALVWIKISHQRHHRHCWRTESTHKPWWADLLPWQPVWGPIEKVSQLKGTLGSCLWPPSAPLDTQRLIKTCKLFGENSNEMGKVKSYSFYWATTVQ